MDNTTTLARRHPLRESTSGSHFKDQTVNGQRNYLEGSLGSLSEDYDEVVKNLREKLPDYIANEGFCFPAPNVLSGSHSDFRRLLVSGELFSLLGHWLIARLPHRLDALPESVHYLSISSLFPKEEQRAILNSRITALMRIAIRLQYPLRALRGIEQETCEQESAAQQPELRHAHSVPSLKEYYTTLAKLHPAAHKRIYEEHIVLLRAGLDQQNRVETASAPAQPIFFDPLNVKPENGLNESVHLPDTLKGAPSRPLAEPTTTVHRYDQKADPAYDAIGCRPPHAIWPPSRGRPGSVTSHYHTQANSIAAQPQRFSRPSFNLLYRLRQRALLNCNPKLNPNTLHADLLAINVPLLPAVRFPAVNVEHIIPNADLNCVSDGAEGQEAAEKVTRQFLWLQRRDPPLVNALGVLYNKYSPDGPEHPVCILAETFCNRGCLEETRHDQQKCHEAGLMKEQSPSSDPTQQIGRPCHQGEGLGEVEGLGAGGHARLRLLLSQVDSVDPVLFESLKVLIDRDTGGSSQFMIANMVESILCAHGQQQEKEGE